MGASGLESQLHGDESGPSDELIAELINPGAERIWHLADAFRLGMDVDTVYEHSGVDPWFLVQIEDIIREETRLANESLADLDAQRMRA